MTSCGGYERLRDVTGALRRREISAAELVDAVLGRIEAWNARISALTEVLADRARAEAREIDARRAAGENLPELAGLPVAVKDIIDTTPAVCSAGLPFLSDYRPGQDAVVTRRLREAGAIVVGVAATDPGAFGVRTPAVTHPQAPERTVGGSSGGSAAALAAGFCYAALGTDTGGSIRIPSACCLLAGLKPTLRRVSTDGVRPLVWSLDHVGPMTRSAADISVIQRVLDPEYDETTSTAPGRPLVVGHDPAYYADAAGEVKNGVARALDACRDMGAEIREVSLPSPDEVLEIHAVVFCSESAAYHFEAFPGRLPDYPAVARELLELARSQRGYEYVRAMRRRAEITRRVQGLFEEVSFLLVPTLAILAPRRDAETVTVGGVERDFTLGLIRYTCLFNHTGNPVLSLPVTVLGPGVGPSVQIVGPLDRDADTVSFGRCLEETLAVNPDYTLKMA